MDAEDPPAPSTSWTTRSGRCVGGSGACCWSAEAHVALTRRICTLVSRHACGPNETGAAPRTSPRAWPFSGLASARWPRLVNLAELRRLSVSLELPPRSSGTSERTHTLLRLAQPAWARDLLACALGALRCPVAELAIAADELPADEDLDAIGVQPLHEGAADALLSVLGEGPHPSVSRLELTARRFLGTRATTCARCWGGCRRSRPSRCGRSRTTRWTRGGGALAEAAPGCGPVRGVVEGGLGPGALGALEGLEVPFFQAPAADFARLAAGPAAGRLARLELAGARPPSSSSRRPSPPPPASPPSAPSPSPSTATPRPPSSASRRRRGRWRLWGRPPSCGSSQWPSTCAATGPTGPPRAPLLAALASAARRAPRLAALSLRLVRRAGEPGGAPPRPGPRGAAGLLAAAGARGVLRLWSAYVYDGALDAGVAEQLAALPPSVRRVELLHRVRSEADLAAYAALRGCPAGRLLIGVLAPAGDAALLRACRERLAEWFGPHAGEAGHPSGRAFVHVQASSLFGPGHEH
eukprot:tig00021254_g19706.t1